MNIFPKHPNPGTGWRILRPDEQLQDGDEWQFSYRIFRWYKGTDWIKIYLGHPKTAQDEMNKWNDRLIQIFFRRRTTSGESALTQL